MDTRSTQEPQIRALRLGPIATNCYLVRSAAGGGFLVDPAADFARIQREAAAMELVPEAILLTHGHFDHIGACTAAALHWRIPVTAGQQEASLLSEPEANLSMEFGVPAAAKADRLVRDGEILRIAGIRIRVFETPGHTAGSVCYELPDWQILFSGDTLFAGSYGRTDFPTGSESAMARSIRRLLTNLPEETRVYPGHGEPTDIQTERSINPLYQQP